MRKHPSCNRIILTLLAMMSVVMAEAENNADASQNSSGVWPGWDGPGCSKAAEEIASNLDLGVDPCDDFYQFSCGGWKDRHEMTDDRPAVFVQSVMQDNIDRQFKDFLGKPLTAEEPDYVRNAKQIYQSCVDVESIEAAGSEPLEQALEILGGWPVVEGERWGEEEEFDWIDALALMRRMGFDHNVLFSLFILPDTRNGSLNIITLDEAVLGLPDRSYYLLSGLEGTAAYYRVMVRTAEKLGADPASARTQMMDALRFETALANYSIPLEERENVSPQYNKYTVKTLQEQVPQIDWMKYLNGLLDDPISEEEPLVIAVPSFLFRFADLITKTDKRVVSNYMLWRVALQSLPALSEAWSSLWAEHESALSGRVEAQGRDEICLYAVGEHLHIALSALYVRNFFPQESRQGVLEIANYIQKEIINTLGNVEWMDQETRRYAKEKANAMKKYIGYPKELLNDDLVSELFKNLIITDGGYFKNLMKMRKWKTDEEFSPLRHPNLNGGWTKHVFDMAVTDYNYEDNSIDFPATIIQNPFFDVNRPQYLNFGGIGSEIAAQMAFGFHNKGRQYDKSGNNFNWWDSNTEAEFKKKAECIVQQYSNYTTEHGLKVDGALTLDNNIAANVGLKEAYKAYQSWAKEHGPEDQLPGLNYSSNQLFWIAAANICCGKFRAEYLEQQIAIGYTPPQFLVNGPVSQLPEFARDFQCGTSTNMNPPNKCQLW